MPDKYIEQDGGLLAEKEGTDTSTGAAEAGKIVALDGAGLLSVTMLPTGVGPDVAVIEASETLAAGDLVNIHDATGVKVRKADASDPGKRAHGFVLAAVTSGQNATVHFEGRNTEVSGLTIGEQFLSATTPGTPTNTAPSGTGEISQVVGVAISATELNFESARPIRLA